MDLFARAIVHYSDARGISPALLSALIACESRFRPRAVSKAGAMGLGQLMPATAAGLGVKDAFNPLENIAAAARLLRGHLDKFAGRSYSEQLALALACYNAGSGTVRKYGGVPPYPETRAYIKKVSQLFSQLYHLGYR